MAVGIIFIGLPGSGKTTAVEHVHSHLTNRGLRVLRFDDKDYLMREAVSYINGRDVSLGPIDTAHAVILNPGVAFTAPRSLQLLYKDGRLLNDAHRKIMIEMAAAFEHQDTDVILADLAYGNDVEFGPGLEPIRQSGAKYIQWFKDFRLLDNPVLIFDIQAPLGIRSARNDGRDEKIPFDEFLRLFPDGGGFTDADRFVMGARYTAIRNDGSFNLDEYLHIIGEEFNRTMLPHIRGENHRFAIEVV